MTGIGTVAALQTVRRQGARRPGWCRSDRWPRTGAGRPPGRSACTPSARRKPGTPPPGCSRSAPRCRCTAFAHRHCGHPSSGHRCRRGSAPPRDRPAPRPHSRARRRAPYRRPTPPHQAAAASDAASGRQPAQPAANTSDRPHQTTDPAGTTLLAGAAPPARTGPRHTRTRNHHGGTDVPVRKTPLRRAGGREASSQHGISQLDRDLPTTR
jgi:hypothetical protein